MTDKIICKDRQIAELFPWYITNSISKIERHRIEKHLASCPVCKKELATLKSFYEEFYLQGKSIDNEHINSVLLTIYSENKKELDHSNIQRIENHLAICANCKNEVDILKKVNLSLTTSKAESFWQQLVDRVEQFIFKPVIKPVFAYALVLLLIYPAWLGIMKISEGTTSTTEPVNINKHFVLEPFEQRAGTGSPNIILLEKTTELFTFSFNIPVIDNTDYNYKAIIVDDNNKTVWKAKDIKQIDAYGSILLVCNKRYFHEGTYTLFVNEKNKDELEAENEYKFVFKVQMNE